MATPTIRIKRRASGGAAGAPSSLQQAELAFNETDSTVYIGVGTGGAGGSATSIIPVAGPGAFVDKASSQTISGAKTFSSSPQVPTASPGDSSGNAASTGFVAAALGSVGGSQAANTVYAGPSSGANAAPSYRALVPADIPPIPSSKLSDLGTGNGAASLVNGVLPISQLPASVTGSQRFVSTLPASGALPSSPLTGQFWIITTAGTFTGTTHSLSVGDYIIYDGSGSPGRLGATGWDYIDNSVMVSSVFGRLGPVVAQTGDYTSDQVTEGTTNLYFTASRVLSVVLTGVSSATNTAIAATDSILSALGKLQSQVNARLIAANNLSDLTVPATARTNLGLGTVATQNASAVAFTGGTLDSVIISNSSFDGGQF